MAPETKIIFKNSKQSYIGHKNIFKMFGKIQSFHFPHVKTFPNFKKILDKKVPKGTWWVTK